MYQDLIVVIVDKYYSEEVIAAATEAGAYGGTILYGRGFDAKPKKKLLNIVVGPEKEVVFILSKQSDTTVIADSIDKQIGISENNNGTLLILDVLETLEKGIDLNE